MKKTIEDLEAQVLFFKSELEKKTTQEEKYLNEMISAFALHEIIVDSSNKPIDYRYLKVNIRFEELTKLKRENIIGKTVKEILPKTEDFWINTFGRVALTGIPETFENYSGELGRYYEVKAYSPEKGLFAVIFNDITHQVNLVNELKNYEKIFTLSIDLICIVDYNGTFKKVNPAIEKILKYKPYEVEGKKIYDFMHPDDIEPTIEFCNEKIRLNESSISYENRYLNKSGEIRWISWNTLAINELNLSYSVGRDVTRLKQIESELIKEKERAQESDRLKSAFLANMSHEIRTPMNGILGFTELMATTELPIEKRKYFSEIIHKSGKQLLRIINDIIDISKIEIGQIIIQRTPVQLKSFMDDIYAFHKPQGNDKELNFLLKISPDIEDGFIIDVDMTKLRQILDNLITNALKFTLQGEIVVSVTKEKNTVKWQVKDTGIGIPKKHHSKVFTRFLQLDNAIGGTGLGLAISKAFVDKMGGKIHFESQENVGTLFEFTIPFNVTLNKVKHPKEDKKHLSFSEKKALIVDDESINVILLEEVLKQMNIQTYYAENGKNALELFETYSFDLILMDIRLPDISGFELVKNMRTKNPAVKIVAQTAFALTSDQEKTNLSGFDAHISKPIDISKLKELIQKVIQEK